MPQIFKHLKISLVVIAINFLIITIFLVPTAKAATAGCTVMANQGLCANSINGDNNTISINSKLDCDIDLSGTQGVCCCTPTSQTKAGIATTPDKGSVAPVANAAAAQNDTNLNFLPTVTIPNSKYVANNSVKMEQSTAGIINYIKAYYNYGIAIVGIVAAIMLMIGGLIWITAQGNAGKIQEAQGYVGASLAGLFLVFGAYLILGTVNPDLVNLKVTSIEAVRRYEVIYCCGGTVNNDVNDTVNYYPGFKSFQVYVDQNGQKTDKTTKEVVNCSKYGAKEVDNTKEICINTGNGYKIESKNLHPACGDVDGYCFTEKPEGWTQDMGYGGADCKDGWCYYHDNNAKLIGESCGSRGTCMTKGDSDQCPSGWEWEGGGGGADCGQDLYCCYNFKAEEKRINFYDCKTASTGASCRAGTGNGYCDANKVCQKCIEYGSVCTEDNQCKDQAGNTDENPGGPCGNQIDGDCTGVYGFDSTCDKNDH